MSEVYTPLEQRIIDGYLKATYPDEPAALDLQEAATMMTLPEDAKNIPLSTFGKMAMDVPAGLAKGALQGTIGLPGDLISLGRGLAAAASPNPGESRLDAFLRGTKGKTLFPTTEDVKKFLDETLGVPLVPAGETDQIRRESAKVSETVGELFGGGKTALGLGKATAQAGAAIGRELAPKAGELAEDFLRKQGLLLDVAPTGGQAVQRQGLVFPAADTADRARLKTQRMVALQNGKPLPGGPKNDRVVIEPPEGSNLPPFAIGNITPQDWITRTESMLKPEEIRQYANWYADVRDMFLKYTNNDTPKADAYMRAWLVANQNIGVDGAFNNVLLQAEQFARGVPEDAMRAGGLPGATVAARRALRGEPITEGVGPKISDFVDSAEGQTLRSYYGNNQIGGAPFVVDIHTARDTGLVDPILLNHLERVGYRVDRNNIKTDFQAGPTDTQYENRADFGRALTQHLNDIGWQGRNDWKPHEVQAVGWMAMTKLTANAAEDTTTALERNLRRISMEVAPGEGSPWAQRYGAQFAALPQDRQAKITETITAKAIQQASRMTGVDVTGMVHGTGGWQTFQNPATVAQALATKQGSEMTANLLGYLLQQTEVWVNSVKGMTKNPKAIAIDFVEDGSTNLANDAGLRDFWAKVMAADPTGLFVGYQPIRTAEGQVGIRVLVDKGGEGRMSSVQSAIEGPLSQMVSGLQFQVRVRGYEADLIKARNDWTKDKDGQAYLGRLADLGLGRAAADFDPLRRELETLLERELSGTGTASRATRAKTTGATTGTKAGQVTRGGRAPQSGAQ